MRKRFEVELQISNDYMYEKLVSYRQKTADHLKEIRSGATFIAVESIDRELGLIDELGTSFELRWLLNADTDIWELNTSKTPVPVSKPTTVRRLTESLEPGFDDSLRLTLLKYNATLQQPYATLHEP